MNDGQKKLLLKVAMDTVIAAIKRTSAEIPETSDPELLAHCGCFVTIKNGHELRGCIGNFTSDKPLIELVHDMAILSATEDSRFAYNPITVKELPRLDIEISVLSPLKKTNDPLSLRLGVDGIYIKRGYTSGCFLPQVATEMRWTKEEFLSYCCAHKAGLAADAWKDPKTEVYLFSAEVFGTE
jgi:uncharacterized protein